MTQFLPPNLLALFAARDAIPYKPPTAALSWEKDRGKSPYCGVAQFMSEFEDPKDTPPPTRGETKAEKKVRRIKEKSIIRAKEIEEEVKKYDPHNDKNATGDAFKTLFVGRINYDTSESKLRREFDMYGPIRKINMVKDLNGKPKGYAFIEFEHERDMHTAYKNADGRKIDGRRVLVDVERGRTVKGWRPLRLGGGLGATRRGANPDNIRQSGRQDTGTARPKEEDRVRDYGRGGSRDRKERRSSRDREKRDRGDRKDRRDRDRDRERSGRDRDDSGKERPRDRDRKHKNRDRSRERDRDSRRKRSRERDRDRERSGRDRSDKDRDRKGRSDRDRERPKEDVPPRSESKPEEYPQPPPKQDYNDQEMDQPGSGNENYNKHSYAEESGEYQGEMKQERKYDDYNDQNGDRNNDYQEKQSKNHEEQQAYLPEGAMEY